MSCVSVPQELAPLCWDAESRRKVNNAIVPSPVVPREAINGRIGVFSADCECTGKLKDQRPGLKFESRVRSELGADPCDTAV